MKIGILGISGRVATRIMREALNRGHEVVGIDHVKGPNVDDAVDFHQLDMEDVEGIAQAIRGCDAYIFTVIPVLKGVDKITHVVQCGIDACKKAGVPRMIYVCGGVSSWIRPGVYLLDDQKVPGHRQTHKANDAIIGSHEDYDIAVLKIDASGLQPVTVGDSDKLNVGDHVLAIGNPLGELTFSMSGGMVSCVNRAINVSGTPFNMIQTDASINPGNSGGPLLNSYGEVVGIVSAKYSSDSSEESVEGLGFAIPINDVMSMIEDIMTNGYVTDKPYLGVTAGTMNAQMAQQTGLTEGVYIYSVEEGGAAAKAGIQVGDVITKVGDTTITSMEDLTAAKKPYSAGDTTEFTIYRQGKTLTVNVTWDSVPADQQTVSTQDESTQDESGNSYNPYEDFFDYFFGNGFSGSSSRDAA